MVSIEVKLYLNGADEVDYFQQFTAFLEKQRKLKFAEDQSTGAQSGEGKPLEVDPIEPPAEVVVEPEAEKPRRTRAKKAETATPAIKETPATPAAPASTPTPAAAEAPQPELATPAITEADLIAAVREYNSKHGLPATVSLLAVFGAKRVGEVPKDLWAQFLAKARGEA